MKVKEGLKKYAKLIIKCGLNLQPDQPLVISAPVEASKLVYYVTKEAYEAGASIVDVRYYDDEVSKLGYEYRPLEAFDHIPEWRALRNNQYAKENGAFLTIEGSDPEAFKKIDARKIASESKAYHLACKEFYDLIDSGKNTWCIVCASTLKWANKVYPDVDDDEAVELLWKAIFKATKVDQKDPVEAWEIHRQSFEERVKYLNSLNLTNMHYTNDKGTDFTIGLNKGYIFEGGGESTVDGIYFFPNIPTEEIFCSPDKDQADGIVYNALPLVHNGTIIDDFYIKFEKGRVVDYNAKVGYDVLKEIIETDEGSHHLGEMALVPYNSSIRNMKTLFYTTLFDENAACHLALGKSFGECIEGGIGLSKEELFDRGMNDSLIHVDFMIGTSDLKIEGIDEDGKIIPLFIDGNYAF